MEDKKVYIISLILGDEELAQVVNGEFKQLKPVKWPNASPDLYKQWYEDCFYGKKDSATFDQRVEKVRQHDYFCYSKPHLKLTLQELDSDEK